MNFLTKRQCLILIVSFSFLLTPKKQLFANATIQVDFVNTNYGSWTPQAKNTFIHAMQIWEKTITSTQIIHIHAKWEDLALKENDVKFNSVLGYAKASTSVTSFNASDPRYDPSYFYPLSLAEKLKGAEIIPTQFSHEIECSFNSNGSFAWYFGTDGNGPVGQFDLVSVVLHEMGHGLGFYSGAQQTDFFTPGTPQCGFNNLVIYDKFITNSIGETPQTIMAVPSNNFNTVSNSYLTSDDLYFTGNQATWNYTWSNQYHPAIYAPTSWQGGSSISHFDKDAFTFVSNPDDGNNLMRPVIKPGKSHHNPGWVGVGLFNDIGWDAVLYLDVDDIEKKSELSVYPNPCFNYINIAAPSGELLKRISINSMDGTSQSSYEPNELNISLDISNLASGLYIIRAVDAKNNIFFNLISKQ